MTIGIFFICSCSSSSESGGGDNGGKTTSTPAVPQPDAGNDLYGLLLDDSGKPCTGVTVSDGYSCVQTDSRGFYQMKRHEGARYVFYATPSDCKARPTQFFQKLNTAKEYDFTLTR